MRLLAGFALLLIFTGCAADDSRSAKLLGGHLSSNDPDLKDPQALIVSLVSEVSDSTGNLSYHVEMSLADTKGSNGFSWSDIFGSTFLVQIGSREPFQMELNSNKEFRMKQPNVELSSEEFRFLFQTSLKILDIRNPSAVLGTSVQTPAALSDIPQAFPPLDQRDVLTNCASSGISQLTWKGFTNGNLDLIFINQNKTEKTVSVRDNSSWVIEKNIFQAMLENKWIDANAPDQYGHYVDSDPVLVTQIIKRSSPRYDVSLLTNPSREPMKVQIIVKHAENFYMIYNGGC